MVLPGKQWALWKWVGLRAAGFPAMQVTRLSAPECSSAADRLIRLEAEAEHLWMAAVESLEEAIGAATQNERRRLLKAVRRLRKGKVLDGLEVPRGAEKAITQFVDACQRVDTLWAEFQHSFEKAVAGLSQVVRQIAGSKRFREAVIWQNRQALHSGVDAVLRKSEQDCRNNVSRSNEELVANYWQRYCAKNDTIGFFGPVGWARLVPKPIAVKTHPGPNLLTTRTVYFEQWCIDAVAQAISRDEAVRTSISPRRLPSLSLRGSTLEVPGKSPIILTIAEAALIGSCDGRQTAKQIAQQLISHPQSGFRTTDEVYQMLEDLHSRGLVFWSLVIPSIPVPEQMLRTSLARIEDETLRTTALGKLDQLELARQNVADMAGDADNLDSAFDLLESTFTKITGLEPVRLKGKTYAGRTLVYEDCRRDIEVEIGDAALKLLADPLPLLLSSARWLTYNLAEQSRMIFKDIYRELVRETGSNTVSSHLFWARAQQWLYSGSNSVHQIEAEFQRRWAKILPVAPDESAVTFSSREIESQVLQLFDSPVPGWNYARYHSPDILIAASSVEAIERGEFFIVLGELHVSLLTLSRSLFVCQHPSPQDLYQALEADLPQPRIIPMLPKHARASRGALALVSPKDFYLEFDPQAPSAAPEQAIPIGSLVVEEGPEGIMARSLDSGLKFEILEVFADLCTSRIMNSFKMFENQRHMPRVTIDRLIVNRESWRFAPAELEFAYEKQEALRFLGARRWAKEYDLPRFVFYKSPVEVKPCFLDLESPIYINIFAKTLRRAWRMPEQNKASEITLTEMLPAPDQAWLPDAEGERYTSELRLIAVDLSSFTKR